MANLPGVEFRPVTITEGDQFVSLMNKTYTRKKTLEYFKWQFFDSPLKTVLMGAFLKERLVGCFGLQCRRLNNGLRGGQAIDLIVDKEFREKGIFTKLGEAATEYLGDSIDFCFSFPNSSGREALGGSLGYQTVAVVKTMETRAVKGNGPAEIVETWNDLAVKDNRKGNGNDLFFIRDLAELNWRFGHNPEYSYTIIRISGDAFAIVKVFVDPVTRERFGDIVDFSYPEGDASLLEGLFCTAGDYPRKKGINKITCWPASAYISRILERIGFTEAGQERYFCVNTLRSGHEYLLEASNWLLVEADAEIY